MGPPKFSWIIKGLIDLLLSTLLVLGECIVAGKGNINKFCVIFVRLSWATIGMSPCQCLLQGREASSLTRIRCCPLNIW